MLTLPLSVRIFIATQPIDMRRGFDTLAAAAQERVGQDPRTGHLFVFFSRHRERVKILFWDRTGYCLFYKRLEQGVFRMPVVPKDTTAIEIAASDLTLVLEGIDLDAAVRRRRYTAPAGAAPGS